MKNREVANEGEAAIGDEQTTEEPAAAEEVAEETDEETAEETTMTTTDESAGEQNEEVKTALDKFIEILKSARRGSKGFLFFLP